MPKRVTLVSMASAAPMGQQRYETEITGALQAVAGETDWDVRLRTMASLRSGIPGARRYPTGLLSRAPIPVAQLIGAVAYRGSGLVHRLDLRLPPSAGPELVTVHDLPPLRFPDEGKLPASAAAGARRAAGIVCPSSFAASEVVELLGVRRAWVIPYGLSDIYDGAAALEDSALERLDVRRPFVVHAAGASLRKNLAGLAEAWKSLATDLPDHTLVLCGPPDGRRTTLFAGMSSTRLLGAQPASVVAGLMAAAAAVVVPSRYEGFGLPALEGMACGAPVVAARAGALPEVCGDAALLVEPTPEGLAGGLLTVASDGAVADRLRRNGPSRARLFSWENAAKAHLRAYEECC